MYASTAPGSVRLLWQDFRADGLTETGFKGIVGLETGYSTRGRSGRAANRIACGKRAVDLLSCCSVFCQRGKKKQSKLYSTCVFGPKITKERLKLMANKE